ncbi:hypothetical protein [Paenibacillus sp. 1P07SE]|uniref:hypothetical protein n=1 Tax=Paenibacillus sp. 1P07SE TaxID=3132209 RepID=UPI0039A45979
MRERKRVFYFVPWISFEAMLLGLMLLLTMLGLFMMLFNQLFGSTIKSIQEAYVHFIVAVPILYSDADRFGNFLLNPLSDPSEIPTTAQMQEFYVSFTETPVTNMELMVPLVFAALCLLFMMWFAYQYGMLKGVWRWIGRSVILFCVVSLPVTYVISTYLYLRSVDLVALSAMPYSEIYNDIQRYARDSLVTLAVVGIITMPLGNYFVFLVGRNKAYRDERRMEKRERRMRRMEEKRSMPRQYY